MDGIDKQELIDRTISKLKAIDETEDTESGHVKYDQVLCELLCELGFEEVVQKYNETDKWFA